MQQSSHSHLVNNDTLGIDAEVETDNVKTEGQRLKLSKWKLRQKGQQSFRNTVYMYIYMCQILRDNIFRLVSCKFNRLKASGSL